MRNNIKLFIYLRRRMYFYEKMLERVKKGKPDDMTIREWKQYLDWARIERKRIIDEVTMKKVKKWNIQKLIYYLA